MFAKLKRLVKASMISTLVLVPPTVQAACMDGTVATRAFTDLGMARLIPSAGVYFFDLNGQTFSSYVNSGGDVLIAIDFGNGVNDLPQGASLSLSARGILSPAILAEMANIDQIRMNSSLGNLNVVNSQAIFLARIQANETLNIGKADNGLHTGWTGIHADWVNTNSSCYTQFPHQLHQNIYHPCGNAASTTWAPHYNSATVGNHQREYWNYGEIPATESLRLFVRAPLVRPACLQVTKSASPTSNLIAGDVVTYTYTITNTGGTDLLNVSLADVHNASGPVPTPDTDSATLTDNGAIGGSSNSTTGNGVWDVLAPDDTLTVTATYTVTQDDVDTLQ